MSGYFNIALVPQEASLTELLTDLAGKNLAGKTENYLLGDAALPHVTLCQFQYDGTAGEVWEPVRSFVSEAARNPLSLRFAHIFIRPGQSEPHLGKNWVGLSVVASPDLIELQKTIYAKFQSLRIESPTLPAKYFPHLTFGRLPGDREISISKHPETDFWHASYRCEAILGRSDQYGVLSERLY